MQKFFPEFEGKFGELLEAVKGRKIAVIGHMRPDGDCVSSQMALAEIFRNAGAEEVVCLNKNPLPRLYKNFAYGQTIEPADEFARNDFEIVTVDCAVYARTSQAISERFPMPLGCIDHHVSKGLYARINIVDSHAASTAEVIAGLALDAGCAISKENANRLYMGMVMDTRQFTTTSTSRKTFAIAGRLVELGAECAWVAAQLYQRESFAKLKLLAAYLKSLTLHFDGKICAGVLPENAYEQTGAEKADSDGLVDYAKSVEGVEIAALLEQLPNGVKGSLRGKTPEYKVNEIAALYGGGGHLAAAGFTAEGERLETFVPKLIEEIERRLGNPQERNGNEG